MGSGAGLRRLLSVQSNSGNFWILLAFAAALSQFRLMLVPDYMSGTFRDLQSWQKAFQLTIEVYSVTRMFPREETYGLTSQLRRAAVSVVSNIAESKGRSTDKDALHFLSNAKGSLFSWKLNLSWQSISRI